MRLKTEASRIEQRCETHALTCASVSGNESILAALGQVAQHGQKVVQVFGRVPVAVGCPELSDGPGEAVAAISGATFAGLGAHLGDFLNVRNLKQRFGSEF